MIIIKKTIKIVFFICIYIVTINTNSYADVLTEIGFKKLIGETEYSISDYSFKSLLEFPLNSSLIGGELTINNDTNINLVTSAWFNITEDAGIMKDSDWFYGYGIIGKDIYSESDAYLDKAIITNLKAEYLLPVNDNLVIKPNVGYKYQRFIYTVKDVLQYGAIDSYDNYYPYEVISVDGEVLKYDVKYKIPYLGVDISLNNKKIILDLGVGISPWTTAEDRDDHILRYKLSTGSTEGFSKFLDIGVSYRLTQVWCLYSKFNYTTVDTSGTQNQYFYAGEYQGLTYSDIDNEINLNQKSFDLGFEYKF